MISPKKKQKKQPQSKKKQLLTIFHQTTAFLQTFTPDQLLQLQDIIHVFVFNKGQILAKETEMIDYVGIIAQGRAVTKSKTYQLGDCFGYQQLLGLQHNHSQSVVGQSDGILLAIRIYDIGTIPKASLSNQIIAFFAEIHTNVLTKRQIQAKYFNQFQTIQQRKITKSLSQQWSTLLSTMDLKEKLKFTTFFPFYLVHQKDLLYNQNFKPSLIYVVKGQLIAKSKQEQQIIQTGKLYNPEGFINNQNKTENVYCLSSEAVVLIINKAILQNNFKITTFNSVLKIIIDQLNSRFKTDQKTEDHEGKDQNMWSMFKKHPNREILPLPKKAIPAKATKNDNTNQSPTLAVFQTLFKEQLGPNDGKLKTNSSVADSNYERLFSMKTQPQGKELQTEGQLQKLRKEVQILTQKLKLSEQKSKLIKLQMIQNKSKLQLAKVHKEIRKLYQEQDKNISKIKSIQNHNQDSLLTFKEAFDQQIKHNKIMELVGKCAYKWLYLTRKHKAHRKK